MTAYNPALASPSSKKIGAVSHRTQVGTGRVSLHQRKKQRFESILIVLYIYILDNSNYSAVKILDRVNFMKCFSFTHASISYQFY